MPVRIALHSRWCVVQLQVVDQLPCFVNLSQKLVFVKSTCIWLLDTPSPSVLSSHPIRLQKEGSDDSTPSSERLGVHVKGEEECGSVHIKGESTESELEEEEEDEDIIQLREGDEEERGSYSQVCV